MTENIEIRIIKAEVANDDYFIIAQDAKQDEYNLTF